MSVHVYGQPDMDGNVYVGDDGNISLPLLGPVNVAALSPVEAAKKMEAALKSRQLLIDPHVEIAVLQSHSQLVSVLGEVKTPGRYPINPGTTVIELLAEAGGATENGADFVYVLRPDARNQIHRYTVDIKGIGDPNDPLSAAVLHAGDSVFVPRAQEFYILGEVKMPGRYRLEPGMTDARGHRARRRCHATRHDAATRGQAFGQEWAHGHPAGQARRFGAAG